MHAATLPALQHRSVSRFQRPGRPVTNAAQGYRLGLPSTAHVSPAAATRNKNVNFLAHTHNPQFFVRLKLSLGAMELPWKFGGNRRSRSEVISKQTDRQAYIHTKKIIILDAFKCYRMTYKQTDATEHTTAPLRV